MRTSVVAASLAAAILLGMGPNRLDAARDPGTTITPRSELLVLEVRNCSVCSLVRQNIQPAYELSPQARDVPMRYVDITSIDELKLGLKSRVDTVPTIVLMRDGREVSRITGYTGPTLFFKALSHMMQRAN